MAAVGTTFDSGSVLGDRFVLSDRLGTGTSARVFLATDLRLQCPVAVKILHESLAADARFVQQFERESRLVASLHHDHVVTVIDAGSVQADKLSVPFIVTEYLAGGSLASLLDSGASLDVAQAASVGEQAADALAHAHRQGLVHRDVKPSNLLFDSTGRLALADFGIARAIASASATEPADSGAGATRYASPEQAMGRSAEPSADVYSLALVLIESVTGSVPLLGDSPVATMGRRMREPVEVPRGLEPLADALEAATTLDPDERCDAGELRDALEAVLTELPEPASLPLAPVISGGDDTAELLVDRTGGAVRILGTAPLAAGLAQDPGEEIDLRSQADTSLVEPTTGEFGRDSIAVAEEYRALDSSRPTSLGVVDPLEAPQRADAQRNRRKGDGPGRGSTDGDHGGPEGPRRRRRWLLVALVVALLGAAGAASWWFLVRVPTHVVPDLVGTQLVEATSAAESNGWEVGPAELVRRDGTTVGQVLGQDPAAGTELAEGEEVSFVVSEGPTLTDVPLLAGLPEEEAVAAIEAAGLEPGARTTAFDEEVPAGALISAAPAPGSQDPEGDGRVPKETAVDYVVSDGPAPRVVPEGIVGVGLADAEAALGAVQLVADVTDEYSSTVPEGVVIRSDTASGTELPRGAAVGLVVSAGPEPIVVPDVTGSTGTAAAGELEAAGFTVSGIEGSPSGTVLATDPPAGESRLPGASVRIFTRAG